MAAVSCAPSSQLETPPSPEVGRKRRRCPPPPPSGCSKPQRSPLELVPDFNLVAEPHHEVSSESIKKAARPAGNNELVTALTVLTHGAVVDVLDGMSEFSLT